MAEPYELELSDPMLLVTLVGDERIVTWELLDTRLTVSPGTPHYALYRMRQGYTLAKREYLTEQGARAGHAEQVANAKAMRDTRYHTLRSLIRHGITHGLVQVVAGKLILPAAVEQVWEQMRSEGGTITYVKLPEPDQVGVGPEDPAQQDPEAAVELAGILDGCFR